MMRPALNWLRIMRPRAFCHTDGGTEFSVVAVNSRRIASHVSTRTTRSDRAVWESPARAWAAPKIAIREKKSSFFMAGSRMGEASGIQNPAGRLKQAGDELESADWILFPLGGGVLNRGRGRLSGPRPIRGSGRARGGRSGGPRRGRRP